MLDPPVFRACDRCYRLKERCLREAENHNCSRCIRLGYACTILRNVRPRGRPTHTGLRQSSCEFVWFNHGPHPFLTHKAVKRHECLSFTSSALSAPSGTLSASPQSASVHDTPFLTVSSSPTHPAASGTLGLVVPTVTSPPPSPSPLVERNLSGRWYLSDEVLLQSMGSMDHFQRYFILGPSFSDYFQSLGKRRFFEFPELVRESSLACAGAVFHARSKKSGFDDINFVRSAVGLRKLRTANVTKTDAGAFLTLGLTLTTFDLITSGTSAHAITRFTLSLVHPLYPLIYMDPGLDSEALCLIFMDTVESLLRRQIPVIRYRVQNALLVDRLVGLCATLLPIMYDVCQFAYESNHKSPSPAQESSSVTFDHLNKLVASWKPQPPPDLLTKFSSQEVICLLSHARVFRAAVSLVLHRLQHPFGIEDQTATRLSTEILSECANYSSIVGEADKLPQTLFPWMVAAFEVKSPWEREMLIQQELSTTREILTLPTAKMKDCVRFVWTMRDASHVCSLFSVLEQAPAYITPF